MGQHELHKMCIEQCEASEGIRERFGSDDAIRHLVGKNFLNFFEESDRRPEFAAEVPTLLVLLNEAFEPHDFSEKR